MPQITETTAPSVAQLSTSIQRQLGELGAGWVEGEVQEAKVHGGHCYLTLADETAQLRGIIWRGRLQALGKPPKPGELIQAHYERIDFYPPKGTLSLIIDHLRMTGIGELLRRRAETLKKLHAEGLTDPARKRRLPRFPRAVGIVTARNSNAWADARKAIWDRFPPTDLVLAPAWVEGVRAVGSIIDALGRLQAEPQVDVIILTRGGAAGVRDLIPFDDEGLCRAIATSTVPVVTAVGHTPDRPNCEQVAADFADVPARAAELVVPSGPELVAQLQQCSERLEQTPADLARRRQDLGDLIAWARPTRALQHRRAELDGLGDRLGHGAERFYADRRARLDQARHVLQALLTRLPRLQDLDVAAERLVGAARRLLADRRAELDQAEAVLRTTPKRIRKDVNNYRRALDRLVAQADRSARCRLANSQAVLQQVGSDLARSVYRARNRIRREVQSLIELARAKDPRRRGWLMAADEHGKSMGRAAGLSREQGLNLHFIDGEAGVTVACVRLEEGEEDE